MDPRERSGLDGLGEDLVLLSVSPADGRISTRQRIGFGLMGSELVRLAASGRITIAGNRVLVQDHSPCGDAELDAALASLAGPRGGVRPKTWVSHPRRGICDAYLARLAAAGAVRAERGVRLGILPVTRWHVTDTARLSEARARLDAIALSTGPADTAQTAYAGLAHAIGLGALLYRGRENRPVRKRLEQIAKGEWPARAVTAAGQDADAVTSHTVAAANQAAIQAAQQAAIAAAVDAATNAAIQASVEAAHHAATDGGGGGGHGHH
jgi:hypothetical protein